MRLAPTMSKMNAGDNGAKRGVAHEARGIRRARYHIYIRQSSPDFHSRHRRPTTGRGMTESGSEAARIATGVGDAENEPGRLVCDGTPPPQLRLTFVLGTIGASRNPIRNPRGYGRKPLPAIPPPALAMPRTRAQTEFGVAEASRAGGHCRRDFGQFSTELLSIFGQITVDF